MVIDLLYHRFKYVIVYANMKFLLLVSEFFFDVPANISFFALYLVLVVLF